MLHRRIEWLTRQLLPLTYRTHYSDSTGRRHFAVWRMWLGRVFDDEDVIVVGSTA